MQLIRVGNRFVNLSRMTTAHVTPHTDTIWIYFRAEQNEPDIVADFEAERFSGKEGRAVIEYLNSLAEVLLWPDTPVVAPAGSDDDIAF